MEVVSDLCEVEELLGCSLQSQGPQGPQGPQGLQDGRVPCPGRRARRLVAQEATGLAMRHL